MAQRPRAVSCRLVSAPPAPNEPPILVAGGINMDVKGRTLDTPQLGTSNPARSYLSPGGVARNIAENLARLGCPVHLLGAVGEDALGRALLDQTASAGVNVTGVLRRSEATGTYTAVLDEHGELLIGLAAMQILDALTPGTVVDWLARVREAALLVLDANLPERTLTLLAREARQSGVGVVLEPVSAPKAERLKAALAGTLLITPDLAELRTLTGLPTRTDHQIEAAARALTEQGVTHVLVTLGVRGSLHVPLDGPVSWTPATTATVSDVTGAGDSFTAGVVAALQRGLTLPAAARWGHASAALTVEHTGTVYEDLSPDTLNARLSRMEHP